MALRWRRGLLAALALAVLGACSSVPSGPVNAPSVVPHKEPRSRHGNPASYTVAGQRYRVLASARGYVATGRASWYGPKFHGRRTSSGERYDMYKMTAAHRTLPLPSYVRVTNLDNGRSAVVRVNDRGPFVKNRLIDLSYAAAKRLGVIADGTARVRVRALTPWDPPAQAHTATHAAGGRDEAWIQVGAFHERGNARRMRERVEQAGIDAVRIERATDDRGLSIYRVRIGPLAGDERSSLIDRLRAHGIQHVRLINKGVRR